MPRKRHGAVSIVKTVSPAAERLFPAQKRCERAQKVLPVLDAPPLHTLFRRIIPAQVVRRLGREQSRRKRKAERPERVRRVCIRRLPGAKLPPDAEARARLEAVALRQQRVLPRRELPVHVAHRVAGPVRVDLAHLGRRTIQHAGRAVLLGGQKRRPLQRHGQLQQRRQQNSFGARVHLFPERVQREQIPDAELPGFDRQKPGVARRQRQVDRRASAPADAAAHLLRQHGLSLRAAGQRDREAARRENRAVLHLNRAGERLHAAHAAFGQPHCHAQAAPGKQRKREQNRRHSPHGDGSRRKRRRMVKPAEVQKRQ